MFGALDRKRMEEERLARAAVRRRKLEEENTATQQDLSKRKASQSPPQKIHDKKRVKDQLAEFPLSLSTPIALEPNTRRTASLALGLTTTPAIRGKVTHPKIDTSSAEAPVPYALSYLERQRTVGALGVQFPDGIVKKTWVHGCPRQGDDIKIEEVLQKDDLDFAVLSAYMVDPEWVMYAAQYFTIYQCSISFPDLSDMF